MKNKFMQWFLSPGAYGVWAALAAPEEWKLSQHTIKHKSGVVLWIANGRFFLEGYDDTPKFIGLVDRHLVWPRIKQMMSRRVFNMLLKDALGATK